MKKFIVGNWKMHGDAAMARPLVEAVAEVSAASAAEVVICPPATLLHQVTGWLVGSKVKAGGQDCAAQPQGAYTGDISAAMLHEAGCEYVIAGHSERRHYHHETNEIVREKAAQAIKTGLVPIICVGETKAEREAGQAEEVVGQQVIESTSHLPLATCRFLLAYEPVWAIGSGKTPTADDIRRMHAHIVSVTSKQTGLAPEAISVLYGGSVSAANAGEIMNIAHVSGVLVGGASLKAEEFCKIVMSAL